MDVSKITLEIFSKLQKKWLMECEIGNLGSSSKAKSKKTHILSIDGEGSIKGLTAGEVLIHLEDGIKSATSDPPASIPDYFNLIAGTGIGGVLAAMLTATDAFGRPLFSTHAAVEYLCSKRRQLFHPAGLLHRRRHFKAVLAGRSFEAILCDFLRGLDDGLLTLKNACKPLLIPCYDLKTSAPFVFSHKIGDHGFVPDSSNSRQPPIPLCFGEVK